MKKNIVIGVGNVLFKDEGIGIYASEYLKKNYAFEGDIEIIDGGTLGFKLMGYFQEYENVIILDTVSIEDKAGEIFILPSEVLLDLGTYRKTAHEVEVVEMLEICSLLENHANVTIIGIIPEDIESVQIGLTKTMEERFNTYILNIVKEIEKLDIKVKEINNYTISKLVKNIIGSYNGNHLNRIPSKNEIDHASSL